MIIPYYKVSKKLVELCLIAKQKKTGICTAPQKLDMKNLTFGVFFNEINL